VYSLSIYHHYYLVILSTLSIYQSFFLSACLSLYDDSDDDVDDGDMDDDRYGGDARERF
jgi:hypothetical protein